MFQRQSWPPRTDAAPPRRTPPLPPRYDSSSAGNSPSVIHRKLIFDVLKRFKQMGHDCRSGGYLNDSEGVLQLRMRGSLFVEQYFAAEVFTSARRSIVRECYDHEWESELRKAAAAAVREHCCDNGHGRIDDLFCQKTYEIGLPLNCCHQ
ncbi:unnamed protein product [Gongylonema pulchrum]|uniref:Uncharacterized protein n=1 Tax=Gongylonema pulchrum TaxID=637853 RepID=A0A183EWU8_9BILA|nr:unnamed protein product [Gongylonema pulchrum]